MRILFATYHAHLPQCTGGMEVNTEALTRALQARGHSVELFCGLQPRTFADRLRRRIHQYSGRRLMIDVSRGYTAYRAQDPDPALPEVLARARPDVVITQGWKAQDLAEPFVRAGVPTLIYMHTADRFAYGPELAAARHLRFAVNSPFCASLHPDKRIDAVLPPLIRPERYRVDSRRQTVLFVNPVPQKGLSTAVKIAAARPDLTFDFCEAWTLSAESRDNARRLTAGLANVRWRAPLADMRRAYRRARLVLFPSAMETWGRVTSEAHISGIPTLGSDRGALPQTIGPGGLCVPFEAEAAAWLEAFNAIWDDEAAYGRYADAALEFARRPQVDPDVIVDTLADLLASMTTGPCPVAQQPAQRIENNHPKQPSPDRAQAF